MVSRLCGKYLGPFLLLLPQKVLTTAISASGGDGRERCISRAMDHITGSVMTLNHNSCVASSPILNLQGAGGHYSANQGDE